MAFATIDVTKGITGTIPVANGGTGLTSGTTGQFLKFTGGTTLASAVGGGITMVDQWRYTTQTQGNVSPITSNLERIDGTAQGTFGSSLMSESSGIFTFPSTGIYLVRLDVGVYINNAKDRTWGAQIQITNDNSNYNELALASGNLFDSDDNTTETIGCQTLIDVTNTTNIKVRFAVFFNNQSSYINGSSSVNKTMFTFTRIGDT